MDTALFHRPDVPLHGASTGRTRNSFIAILKEGGAAKTYCRPDGDPGCLPGLCGQDPKAVGSCHTLPLIDGHHDLALLHPSQSLTVLSHSSWALKLSGQSSNCLLKQPEIPLCRPNNPRRDSPYTTRRPPAPPTWMEAWKPSGFEGGVDVSGNLQD